MWVKFIYEAKKLAKFLMCYFDIGFYSHEPLTNNW